MLFFSTPPLDVVPPVQRELGHSLKYLAAKEERRKLVEEKKRKDAHEREEREEAAKRRRADENTALAEKVELLTEKAIDVFANHISSGTDELYKMLYGDRAEEAKLADIEERERKILADRLSQKQTAQIQAQSKTPSFISLKGGAMYLDDIDPRI